MQESGAPVSERKADRRREIKSWVMYIAAAVCLALVIRFFIFEIVRVEGPSMQPTLQTDESVFVEKVSKLFGGVRRGQIVIVRYPGKGAQGYVKRLVGLPGDRLQIRDGILFINGDPQEEPYINEPMAFSMDEVTVPPGSIFVMGDNRNRSLDSTELGPISEEYLVGHALCVVWPLGMIKGLTQTPQA